MGLQLADERDTGMRTQSIGAARRSLRSRKDSPYRPRHMTAFANDLGTEVVPPRVVSAASFRRHVGWCPPGGLPTVAAVSMSSPITAEPSPPGSRDACTGLGQRRVGLRPTSSVGTTIAKSRAVPGGPIEDPHPTQCKGIDHATSDNSI